MIDLVKKTENKNTVPSKILLTVFLKGSDGCCQKRVVDQDTLEDWIKVPCGIAL
jgi:hypothetical protein